MKHWPIRCKIKKLDHPLYKNFSDKYSVTSNGRVFNGKKELNYFTMSSGGKFVRLFANGKDVSVTVAKLVLLSFRPQEYKKGLIALHINGNLLDDSLKNLRFGTRKEQSAIHVADPKNWKRISEMGKKYGPANGKIVAKFGPANLKKWKEENGRLKHTQRTIYRIRSLYTNGYTPTEIAKKMGISRSSIYNYI